MTLVRKEVFRPRPVNRCKFMTSHYARQEEMLAAMNTIRDCVRLGVSWFQQAEIYYGHGTDNALDEATSLVLYALNLPNDLPGHFMDSALTVSERDQVFDLFRRRVEQRVPAPYLTGRIWFAGHEFKVNEHVLIPRSPIAELIDEAFTPWVEPDHVERVLDMCTGSACIAIACAYVFPEATVDAVDISCEALAVAQDNVEKHEMAAQVSLIESDLFSGLGDRHYDLIVTNPPYVDVSEMADRPEEYLHEPELALASGHDGLDAIRVILRESADHLNDGGVLVAEVGASQSLLAEAFPQVPFLWLDFEHGGDGVFVLTREQLVDFQELFDADS